MGLALTLILVAMAFAALSFFSARKRRQNEEVAEMARRATQKAAGVKPDAPEGSDSSEDQRD